MRENNLCQDTASVFQTRRTAAKLHTVATDAIHKLSECLSVTASEQSSGLVGRRWAGAGR